jgi:hypothetical protein
MSLRARRRGTSIARVRRARRRPLASAGARRCSCDHTSVEGHGWSCAGAYGEGLAAPGVDVPVVSDVAVPAGVDIVNWGTELVPAPGATAVVPVFEADEEPGTLEAGTEDGPALGPVLPCGSP